MDVLDNAVGSWRFSYKQHGRTCQWMVFVAMTVAYPRVNPVHVWASVTMSQSLGCVLSQLHFASSFILPPERLQKGHPQGDLEIIRAPWVVLFFCSQW